MDGSPACLSRILANFLKERVEETIELDDAEEDETRSSKKKKGFEDMIEAAKNDERFETFFNNGNVDEALPMLRQIVSQKSIVNVSKNAYNITKVSLSLITIVNKTIANFFFWLEHWLLQLGNIEKGAMSLGGGFKSLISWWFGKKKRKREEDDGGKDCDDFIERDTLVKLSVKEGGQISSQYCGLLGIFDKSYNRWFVDFKKDKIVSFSPRSGAQ